MRHSTSYIVPTHKVIYDVSEYAVLVGGCLELLTCCFILVAREFAKCAELRTGFYVILSIGFWMDGAWTVVYFLNKCFPANHGLFVISVNVQMFAVLMIGPWILFLALNRYVALVLPNKYADYFSSTKTTVYGLVIVAIGVVYLVSKHVGLDEGFLIKLGQNLTTVLCVISFIYGLESVRSQRNCQWRKQIEDRKLLYLTLTITLFQLIANIMSAYIITWETFITWPEWKLAYYFTGINASICGAQYLGVIFLFVFSKPARDCIYRLTHCGQEPIHNRIRPLAFIE